MRRPTKCLRLHSIPSQSSYNSVVINNVKTPELLLLKIPGPCHSLAASSDSTSSAFGVQLLD